MSRDLKVGLTISAEDRASDKVRQVGREAERQAERVGARTKRAADDATRFEERASQRGQTTHARAARSREQLGIRSEQSIRREIAQTEAAYNRLARTGRMSATEQARAYGQMQNRVSGLRREMGALEQQNQRVSRGMNAGSFALRAGASLAAGATAGAMVLARPVNRTMDYESRLAMMANTAYSDRNADGRIAGMRDLDGAIRNAVRQGGGSRDAAAETLDSMLASGALSHSSAVNLLPTLQKASVATGASGTELADVVMRGMQTFGIKESEIPQMLDMAVKAGQGGGFELKDMARWLPKMMAMGKTAGMGGLQDFGSLVAAAQASMITGGSADAAGNNLANLLAKINSRDTAKQAEKIEIAPGKSIDLAGTLARAAGNGTNSLDAFVGIVDQVIAGDKEYQALQQKIAGLDPKSQQGEMAALMQKQSDILQGSAIGKLIQDQQALLALVGYMGNRSYMAGIKTTYGSGVDSIAVGHEVMASTGEFKTQQAANQWQAAEFDAFKGFSDNIGDLSGKMAELSAEYPEMTKWVVGSTEALKTLAAAAGAAAVVGMVRGRGKGGAAAGGAAAAGEIAAARGAGAAAAAGRGSLLGRVGVAGPLIVAAGAYGAYQVASDDSLSPHQKTDALIGQGSRTGGQLAGAYAGAAAGMFLFGPAGAVVGGAAGAFGGDYLGEELAKYIQHMRNTPTAEESQAAMRAAPNAATLGMSPEQLRNAIIEGQREANKEPQKLDLNVTVDVQNGNIVASVNEVNDRESRRY